MGLWVFYINLKNAFGLHVPLTRSHPALVLVSSWSLYILFLGHDWSWLRYEATFSSRSTYLGIKTETAGLALPRLLQQHLPLSSEICFKIKTGNRCHTHKLLWLNHSDIMNDDTWMISLREYAICSFWWEKGATFFFFSNPGKRTGMPPGPLFSISHLV